MLRDLFCFFVFVFVFLRLSVIQRFQTLERSTFPDSSIPLTLHINVMILKNIEGQPPGIYIYIYMLLSYV